MFKVFNQIFAYDINPVLIYTFQTTRARLNKIKVKKWICFRHQLNKVNKIFDYCSHNWNTCILKNVFYIDLQKRYWLLINLFLYLACQTVYYGPHCDKICNSSCLKQRFYSDKEDCLQVYHCLTVLLMQL